MDPRLYELAGVRRFSDYAIQAAIDRAVLELGPDDHVASVAHVDGEGASVSVVVRVGDQWSIQAACHKAWNGPLEGEANVVWKPW